MIEILIVESNIPDNAESVGKDAELISIAKMPIYVHLLDGRICSSMRRHETIKLILLFAGILILAFGITLSVIANVILNSGEAFVKAVSVKSGKNFADVKVAFDVFCVVGAVLLSLILFRGQIIGTREGTEIDITTGFAIIKKYFREIVLTIQVLLIKIGRMLLI